MKINLLFSPEVGIVFFGILVNILKNCVGANVSLFFLENNTQL